jgi:hypothetical protein
VSTDPLALDQAAAAALIEARRLAGARLEPGMPLPDYLQPLQNLTAAIVSGASTASRLADIAVLAIIDPETGADADGALKKAERRGHQAGDQVSHTFSEIRRALRLSGLTVPYLGGLERLRRYKTTATVLASLSAEAEKAVHADPPLALRYIEDPAANLAGVLEQLGLAAGKLGAGIGDAYTRLPRNSRAEASRATDRIAQSSNDLEAASGHVTRAAGIISDALASQRKMATW